MSYDLHLFAPRPGADLLETAVASLEQDADEIADRPLDQDAKDRKQRLLVALEAVVPHLEPFQLDHDEIARSQGISKEEPRRRFRHVELNGPEDGSGVQVTLFDQSASVTVPYWHSGERAAHVLREIWTLATIEREGGLRTYDPQLEDVISLDHDFGRVLSRYTGVVEVVHRPTQPAAAKKPWWRFW